MKEDCMFQFGTEREIFEDTALISLDEALHLFNKNKDKFKEQLDLDKNP